MKKFSSTPGGSRLRLLREKAGKTQMTVELDANLGSGYLQRVEAGKVANPERETLERILVALAARYSERREVLELFGYTVKTPLPNQTEINWALSICQNELCDVTFPAYVLDCSHRLLAYNAYFGRLVGGTPRNPLVNRLLNKSMLTTWFEPVTGLLTILENPAEFLPAVIQAFKFEMRLFQHEDWNQQMLAEIMVKFPLFKIYWERSKQTVGYAVAARPLGLVGLKSPEVGVLRFRLSSEAFIQDARFRLIYYLPADAKTIQQCATWAETSTVS